LTRGLVSWSFSSLLPWLCCSWTGISFMSTLEIQHLELLPWELQVTTRITLLSTFLKLTIVTVKMIWFQDSICHPLGFGSGRLRTDYGPLYPSTRHSYLRDPPRLPMGQPQRNRPTGTLHLAFLYLDYWSHLPRVIGINCPPLLTHVEWIISAQLIIESANKTTAYHRMMISLKNDALKCNKITFNKWKRMENDQESSLRLGKELFNKNVNVPGLELWYQLKRHSNDCFFWWVKISFRKKKKDPFPGVCNFNINLNQALDYR